MKEVRTLEKQLGFIVELDKLKNVYRRTLLMDGSRNENDAEHSWHLALMALVLAKYARETVDMLRVLKMVLLHDIVEIDAGAYGNQRLCGRNRFEYRFGYHYG